ncbi:zinc finger, CCHC-type containing protein [Tanacetum coccineum]
MNNFVTIAYRFEITLQLCLFDGSKPKNNDELQPRLSNFFKNFDYNGGGRWLERSIQLGTHMKGGDGGEIQGKGKGKKAYANAEPSYAPKPKNPPPPKKDNTAKDAICHHCSEVGHWRRNCPTYLTELLKKKQLSQGAITLGSAGNAILRDGVYEIEMSCSNTIDSSMYAVSNKKAKLNLDSSLLWHCRLGHISKKRIEKLQHDGLLNSTNIEYLGKCVSCMSGKMARKTLLTINLEIIQEEDTNPSLDTGLNHEEDDQEIDEPQSDINPIRRSTRTKRAPDRMCLYIDAEEHELGDLGEPTNYKAVILDHESEKWLAAMNVKMQSIKDNDIWELVKLPPNPKTIGHKWLFKKKTDMEGAIHTFKSRLIAKGFTQTYWVDYEETFSPVADIRAIRILIAIAAFYDYEIWQMDVKTAFLNGHPFRRNGASTPAEKQRMSNVPYASAVGSIMYAVRCTRPDVNIKDMFLVYGGDMKRDLRVSCYTNAGYLIDADDLKSQTGYVFILNGGAVDWKSTKQSIFATSSTDAKYIVAFDASKEAVWIRKFIYGLNVVPIIEEPITMYCDNTGAIAIANDHGVTKGA